MQDTREQDFLDPFVVVRLHLRIDSNTPRKWGGKAYRSKMPMRQERGGGREETKDHSLLTRPLTCIQPVIPFLWLFLNTCTTQASSPPLADEQPFTPSLPPSIYPSGRPTPTLYWPLGNDELVPCQQSARLNAMRGLHKVAL